MPSCETYDLSIYRPQLLATASTREASGDSIRAVGSGPKEPLRLCNARTAAQLPDIWQTVPPLKKDRARSAMEAACQRTTDSLHLSPPRIPHTIVVMVMALTLHTEYPNMVGGALNIFLFPDLHL